MTDKQIYTYFGEASKYADPDSYASDVVIGALDTEDQTAEPNAELHMQLVTVWHVANDSFRDLLELIGLNQTQCSNRFCIPLRTVQDWAGKRRVCNSYVRLMMAEAMGVVHVRD